MIRQTLSLILKTSLILVLIFAYTKFIGPFPFSLTTRNLSKDNSLYITSEGSFLAKPNTASTTIGVTVNATTAKEVQKMTNEKINKVVSSIKALGVDEKKIKTTNYSIYPTYGPNSVIAGYSSNVSISVKDTDIDRMNKVLDSATQNGANVVSGLTFEIEDKDTALAEARKDAVTKAKKKAEDMAKVTGIKLGRIINVSEYYPTTYEYNGLGGGAKTQETAPSISDIQTGQTEVKVNVTLTYEIL